jgi:hypothetical protein
MKKLKPALLLGAVIALGAAPGSPPVHAQELEPRLLSNVPKGMNFGILGYAYSTGNILLDPAISIDDLDSRVHTLVGAFVHSFSLAGVSSKVDVVVPLATGDWTGIVEGRDSARSVSGLGDPRVRLSVAFVGAPAMERKEFGSYIQETVVGASLQIIAPLGQYDPSKLINLGSNRWTARATLGASKVVDRWIVEGYAGAWLFGDNTDFFGGNLAEQAPLLTAKTHLIRLFDKGRWLAFDLGYGVGGQGTISGVERDNRISTFRFGATLALPVAAAHTLRFTLLSGVRLEKGPDFDAYGASWQYRR